MNYNNLAQKTNYAAGSEQLELLPFYLTSVSIPGISFNLQQVGGRTGSRMSLSGDTIEFNSLSFEILIDEDFKVYNEFMDIIFKHINVESGTFADFSFDFWIEINNSKSKHLMKYEFYNCRIENVGDIQLDTTDDITEHTMSVELKYDYYNIIKNEEIPLLRT